MSTPTEIHDVQELLHEYTTWAFTLAAESNQAPTFQGVEQELAALPGPYAPPTGSLLLARQDNQAAGFRKVDTPSDFPENLKPIVVFMELNLEGA